MRRALLLVAAVPLLAACSGSEESGTTSSTAPPPVPTAADTEAATTSSGPTRTSSVLVYFIRDGKVAAARRTVSRTGAVGAAAIGALIEGPTPEEADAGLATAIPPETRLVSLVIANGIARIALEREEADELEVNRRTAVAQIVYTLTQFPSVRGVVFEDTRVVGKGLTRQDMEDDTPAIFVESPVVGETVRSPIRVRGTANTFEAVLTLRLESRGRKIAERFVMATSGTGTRGTFDTTIAVPAGVSGRIMLVAFEPSAANGEPLNVVRIPLVLAR